MTNISSPQTHAILPMSDQVTILSTSNRASTLSTSNQASTLSTSNQASTLSTSNRASAISNADQKPTPITRTSPLLISGLDYSSFTSDSDSSTENSIKKKKSAGLKFYPIRCLSGHVIGKTGLIRKIAELQQMEVPMGKILDDLGFADRDTRQCCRSVLMATRDINEK